VVSGPNPGVELTSRIYGNPVLEETLKSTLAKDSPLSALNPAILISSTA